MSTKIKKSNGISIYKKSIKPELCQTLIKLYKDNKDSALLEIEDYVDDMSQGCNVRSKYIMTQHFPDIDSQLLKIMESIATKAVQANSFLQCSGDCGYQLREIYGATRLHADQVWDVNHPYKVKTVAVILALNSDYEGGKFYFPFQDYKVKLKQGDAIVFPAAHTHPHQVSSPKNGTVRYTINTWFHAMPHDKT